MRLLRRAAGLCAVAAIAVAVVVCGLAVADERAPAPETRPATQPADAHVPLIEMRGIVGATEKQIRWFIRTRATQPGKEPAAASGERDIPTSIPASRPATTEPTSDEEPSDEETLKILQELQELIDKVVQWSPEALDAELVEKPKQRLDIAVANSDTVFRGTIEAVDQRWDTHPFLWRRWGVVIKVEEIFEGPPIPENKVILFTHSPTSRIAHFRWGLDEMLGEEGVWAIRRHGKVITDHTAPFWAHRYTKADLDALRAEIRRQRKTRKPDHWANEARQLRDRGIRKAVTGYDAIVAGKVTAVGTPEDDGRLYIWPLRWAYDVAVTEVIQGRPFEHKALSRRTHSLLLDFGPFDDPRDLVGRPYVWALKLKGEKIVDSFSPFPFQQFTPADLNALRQAVKLERAELRRTDPSKSGTVEPGSYRP